MRFSRSASYNNPHMMFPSASKLFSGMNSVAGKLATKTVGVNSYNSASPTTTTVTMTTTATTSISKNSLNTVIEEAGLTLVCLNVAYR
jgi:hypothetical protein